MSVQRSLDLQDLLVEGRVWRESMCDACGTKISFIGKKVRTQTRRVNRRETDKVLLTRDYTLSFRHGVFRQYPPPPSLSLSLSLSLTHTPTVLLKMSLQLL